MNEDKILKYIEKRKYYRLPCFIEVEFSLDGEIYTATALNISIDGIFLETDVKFNNDQMIIIFFSSIDHQNDFQIQGVVRWISHDGVGAEFVKKCIEDEEHILNLIDNSTSIIRYSESEISY